MNGFRAALAGLLLALAPSAAVAQSPALEVPQAALDASLVCEGDLAAGPAPVLLVPGTGEDPDFYDTNYKPALRLLGRSFCTVTLPEHGTADVQTAAEHVVHAIRTMHARAGRRIAIIGHSQGGMVPRWAFKYFPDTRPMVEDLIGLASSNHGTTGAETICADGCSEAVQQQRDDSKFIAALNAGGETFAGISYTSVFTHNDEIVMPNADAQTGSTALRTGDGARSNVATQDICPASTAEHLVLGSTDPVGYALAVDALTHDGPADPARVDPAVCAQVAQPGVNPVTGTTDTTAAFAKVAVQFSTARRVQEEPPLRCYVTDTCAEQSGGSGSGSAPRVTDLRANRRCVRSARLTAARPGRRGLSFRFRLSALATVRYEIQRRMGSPRWSFCPPRGGSSPGRYDSVARRNGDGRAGRNDTSLATTSSARSRMRSAPGRRSLPIARVAAGRRLTPGTYLLRVTATNAQGRSATAKVKFWVLR